MQELYLELKDTEWEFEYTDNDREIARAIVFDDSGYFYFVHVNRGDEFGPALYIETAGGGVEPGEDLNTAIKRELLEELGVKSEVLCKLGVVSDYYNLIHRHNINNYFLCRIISFEEKHLTPEEIEIYRLTTAKLTYEQALSEYEKGRSTRLGRLVAARELPILRHAKMILDNKKYDS